MEIILGFVLCLAFVGAVYWWSRKNAKTDHPPMSFPTPMSFPDTPRYPTQPARFDDSSLNIPVRTAPPVVMSRPSPRRVDSYPSTTYRGETYYRSPEGSFYDRNGMLVNAAVAMGLGALAYGAFSYSNQSNAAQSSGDLAPLNNLVIDDVPVVPMVPRQPVMQEETMREEIQSGGMREATLDAPNYSPSPSFVDEDRSSSSSFSDSSYSSSDSFSSSSFDSNGSFSSSSID